MATSTCSSLRTTATPSRWNSLTRFPERCVCEYAVCCCCCFSCSQPCCSFLAFANSACSSDAGARWGWECPLCFFGWPQLWASLQTDWALFCGYCRVSVPSGFVVMGRKQLTNPLNKQTATCNEFTGNRTKEKNSPVFMVKFSVRSSKITIVPYFLNCQAFLSKAV